MRRRAGKNCSRKKNPMEMSVRATTKEEKETVAGSNYRAEFNPALYGTKRR